MSPPAKSRTIAIPVDLDNQVNNLFVKSNSIVQKTAMSWRMSVRNASRRDSVVASSPNYRNIIERLQVQIHQGLDLYVYVYFYKQIFCCLESRTLCQRWRTDCIPWSRRSCRFWWMCCIDLSCFSRKTPNRARSVRAEASYASTICRVINSLQPTGGETEGFTGIFRLIKHTKQLLEENEEKLCIKVLQTLREMMTKDRGYGDKVRQT